MKRLLACCCLLLVASCGDQLIDPTEIVLVVDSDLTTLHHVRVEIRGFGDGEPIEVPLEDDWLPRTVALVHEGGPLGPIDLTVSGYALGDSEPILVEPRKDIFFVRDQTRVLRVELREDCVAVCDAKQACVVTTRPVCQTPEAAVELSPWKGWEALQVLRPDLKEQWSPDAGSPSPKPQDDAGMDAGTKPEDAGTDAASDAKVSPAPDAQLPTDARMPDTTPPPVQCEPACVFEVEAPHALGDPQCVSGRCEFSCELGWADCDGELANGCEAAVDSGCGCTVRMGYRKALTVRGSEVSGSLASFPIMVSLTDSDLRTHAAASGLDLCFADADGQSLLPFEIERWDSESGSLLSWVALPELTAGVDREFFLYYGSGSELDRATPSAVWDDDYLGVYHGADSSDASGYGHGARAVGARVEEGMLGATYVFDGRDDYLELSQGGFDDLFVQPTTIEAWIRLSGFGEDDLGRIMDKASDTGPDRGWSLFVRDDFLRSQTLCFAHDRSGGVSRWVAPDGSIRVGTWTHVAVVYAATLSEPRIYLDGIAIDVISAAAGGGALRDDADSDLRIGNHSSLTSRTFDGAVDEVRISTTARSRDWLATQVKNQQEPDAFMSVGEQQVVPE